MSDTLQYALRESGPRPLPRWVMALLIAWSAALVIERLPNWIGFGALKEWNVLSAIGQPFDDGMTACRNLAAALAVAATALIAIRHRRTRRLGTFCLVVAGVATAGASLWNVPFLLRLSFGINEPVSIARQLGDLAPFVGLFAAPLLCGAILLMAIAGENGRRMRNVLLVGTACLAIGQFSPQRLIDYNRAFELILLPSVFGALGRVWILRAICLLACLVLLALMLVRRWRAITAATAAVIVSAGITAADEAYVHRLSSADHVAMLCRLAPMFTLPLAWAVCEHAFRERPVAAAAPVAALSVEAPAPVSV